MTVESTLNKPRLRSPSQRSLATRARILDAAERVFALHGFDGASLRNIADECGEHVGLVHHHSGGKEALFHQTIARRAKELSAARLSALARAKASSPLNLHSLFRAFFGPYMELSQTGPQWLAYARLIAHVSADPRWRHIAANCFDPTAGIFLDEINRILPETPRSVIATNFVFSVSAMLAVFTSQWRVDVLGKTKRANQNSSDSEKQLDHLIQYCAAGFLATTEL